MEEPHALRLAAQTLRDRQIMLSCLAEAADEAVDDGFFATAHGRELLSTRVRALGARREALLQRLDAGHTRALNAEILADARRGRR